MSVCGDGPGIAMSVCGSSGFWSSSPGAVNVTECGSIVPVQSQVTVAPVATVTDSGRNSSTAMFVSFG